MLANGEPAASVSVYKKVKSNFVRRHQMDSDPMKDLIQEKKKSFPKYIQIVSNEPFFVTLWLESAMCLMRDSIKSKIPTSLHFDATGNILNAPKTNQPKFYYALVCHFGDPINLSLPVLEAFSECHSVDFISFFLGTWKTSLYATTSSNMLPSAVVCDWSWASIHSILQNLLNTTVSAYLRDAFEVCCDTSQAIKLPKTVLLLCSAHVIKIFSNHNAMQSMDRSSKSFILHCLGSIMQCSDFRTAHVMVKHLLTLLKVRSSSSAAASVKFYQASVWVPSSTPLVPKTEECHFTESVAQENCDTLFKTSPFYHHFKSVGDEIDDNGLNDDNPYYCPSFYEALLRQYLPYIPLWSPILSRHSLSNAAVESWFRTTKNSIINGAVSPADFARLMKPSILGRVQEASSKFKTAIVPHSESPLKEDNVLTASEKWTGKRQKEPQTSRSVYFENRGPLKVPATAEFQLPYIPNGGLVNHKKIQYRLNNTCTIDNALIILMAATTWHSQLLKLPTALPITKFLQNVHADNSKKNTIDARVELLLAVVPEKFKEVTPTSFTACFFDEESAMLDRIMDTKCTFNQQCPSCNILYIKKQHANFPGDKYVF